MIGVAVILVFGFLIGGLDDSGVDGYRAPSHSSASSAQA